ncbi:MAG TPA: nucleotidyltransferase [Enterococcus columbae]|nr:nucleotidyltransferase [Enterococcus columbae]
MKACGMIVEYNPFHNGHLYHLRQSKQQSNAEVIIAVMSGNFLQRGEPAIIDKWHRAQSALQNGADLVIELPVEWSVQSADYFAEGGLDLLHALGCENLCFGTDQSDEFDYQNLGKLLVTRQAELDKLYQSIDDPKLTYAQKMMQVFQQFDAHIVFSPNQPNHILALSYAQANAKLANPLNLIAIKRIKAGYHDQKLPDFDLSNQENLNIASATAIRNHFFAKQSIKEFIPESSLIDLSSQAVSWADFYPYLKYRILSSSHEQLQQIYQMVDGLEYKLKQVITEVDAFDQLLQAIKSKRYTKTRLQRLLMYVLLNIQHEQIIEQQNQKIIHVLGFSEKGQQYLRQQKKYCPYPIVTRMSKQVANQKNLLIQSDRIYQLANVTIKEQNFGRLPIRSTDFPK